MPLDVRTLLTSSLWIKAKKQPIVAYAAVSLWCESWHQVPAGSLPDDDEVLAHLAICDETEWMQIRDRVLHNFVKCSDGRLYHRMVAQKAIAAWQEKMAHKARTKAATDAREAKRKAEQAARDSNATSTSRERDVQRDVNATFTKGEGEGEGELKEIQGLRPSVDDAPSAVDRPGLALVETPGPEIPDCPQQELVALYRKRLPHLRQPATWDGQRADAMRTRWRECAIPSSFGDGYATKAEGLEFWDRFFAFVAENPKLRDGITSRDNGQVRVWKPSLDWLVTRGNFLKVIEGAFSQ
jgi:uncharacterized protein YdaU (DUF1376 family)